MSSNATADVPPDATAGTGPAAPADVAEAAVGAQPGEEAADVPVTEASGSQPAEAKPDPAAEPSDIDAGATSPAEAVGEPAGPAGENEPAELAGEPAELAEEPIELAGEPIELAEEPIEPAGEPIEMAEPVEFAEPVDEHEPRRRGHGVLLTAGFVLAALAIIGGAIAIVGSVTHGFKKPVKVTYTKSAVFSLRTGQCIDPNGQSASVVSCATPHDAEVFATFTLPSSKWPGATGVQTAASSGCATRLTAYINPQLAISLASTYVYPDSVAWQAGTRTVICEVTATSGQLTGSVRGATATAG